jgi:hypothetical protein
LENLYGGIKFEPDKEFISGPGIAQPLIFRHTESILPDLLIHYFYYKLDSTLAFILHEWDNINFKGNQENQRKTENEITAFIDRYNFIYDSIIQIYGKSHSEGDLTDRSKIATGNFEKIDVWKPNLNTEIELYMILSSYYKKTGPITINPTYRIRLKIRSKK